MNLFDRILKLFDESAYGLLGANNRLLPANHRFFPPNSRLPRADLEIVVSSKLTIRCRSFLICAAN